MSLVLSIMYRIFDSTWDQGANEGLLSSKWVIQAMIRRLRLPRMQWRDRRVLGEILARESCSV